MPYPAVLCSSPRSEPKVSAAKKRLPLIISCKNSENSKHSVLRERVPVEEWYAGPVDPLDAPCGFGGVAGMAYVRVV
jgi:hypothetical protein